MAAMGAESRGEHEEHLVEQPAAQLERRARPHRRTWSTPFTTTQVMSSPNDPESVRTIFSREAAFEPSRPGVHNEKLKSYFG